MKPMKSLLRILDSTGDTRVAFDTQDPVSFAEADKVFREKISRGYSAFSTPAGGAEPAKRISELKNASEETILISPITGG